ncbi:MAG TPA: division/cell wall cluster transcriptional repressor MraZ [Vitreimonas sp.]|nr:division/cell wall cluster transcriptional repressor MraZ [Vitreimonas sp.]
MFIGKYYHSLESKGRVSLPKNFRKNTTDWIVTRGLDGGLFLFPASDFIQKIAELEERTFTKKTHRDFIRLMTNEAAAISADAQGRVQLPEYLIEFAQLRKELVVVGSLKYIEIWDRDSYHTYTQGIEARAEEIAESLQDA